MMMRTVQDGIIAGIGKAGNPQTMTGVTAVCESDPADDLSSTRLNN
jgi:urease alpha subunit